MSSKPYSIAEVASRLRGDRDEPDLEFVMRQIRHWTNNDLLRTSGAKHTGMGKGRKYDRIEVIVAGYLQAFSRKGLTIGALKQFRAEFDDRMERPEANVSLFSLSDETLPGYVRYTDEATDQPFLFFSGKNVPLEFAYRLDPSDPDSEMFDGITIVSCASILSKLKL